LYSRVKKPWLNEEFNWGFLTLVMPQKITQNNQARTVKTSMRGIRELANANFTGARTGQPNDGAGVSQLYQIDSAVL